MEKTDWGAWAQGLISAALSGAANSAAAVAVVPDISTEKLSIIAGVGALVGVANLFKEKPPKKTTTRTRK